MTTDMLRVPTAAQAAEAVQQARRLFARVMTGWASDALVLRRSGAHRLVWRAGREIQKWNQAA